MRINQLIALIFFCVVFALSFFNTAQAAQPNYATFSFFQYTGKDKVYEKHSLSKDEFYNPILPGFYPDPSICAKGDTFYLVNSTFSFYPGVPISKSTDLVHWQQIGHILNRPSQINLKGLAISNGIYAPAITYNPQNDMFYMITTLVGHGGNFVVKAKNPAGPWSDPIWLPEVKGIDPSMFIDDSGKAYVVNNQDPDGSVLYNGHRAIWIHEYDLSKDKIVSGTSKMIINGGSDIAKKPIWIEGPHMYKVNGYYYLMAAEGGTGENHSEVIFRSNNPYGPFESFDKNPILTQRNLPKERLNPVTCTGHADIIQTKKGEWWAVFLGCRPYKNNYYNSGRETFLMPVKWIDGWPIITEPGKEIPLTQKRPDLPEMKIKGKKLLPSGNFIDRDNFDKSTLGINWNFIRVPDSVWYKLNSPFKGLNLMLRPESIGSKGNPSFIGRRIQHATFEVKTSLIFNPAKQSESAGLVLFQNEKYYYYFKRGTSDKGDLIQLEKSDGTGRSIIAERVLSKKQEKIFLKVSGDGEFLTFDFSLNGTKWNTLQSNVDATILSTGVAGGFTGAYIGMYASSIHR